MVVVILSVNLFSGAFGTSVAAGDITQSEIVELTNSERVAAGLNALTIDDRLSAAAQAKADDIFADQYWSHYGPDGQTPWDFVLASGYDYVYAGENLAKGFTSSDAVVSAWMASKTHRDNILGANYENIGVAVVSGNLLGADVILVVQMFGSLSLQTSQLPFTSEVESQVENSTIEILYPEEGLISADNSLEISGTSSGDIQEVDIADNDISIGESICNDGVWDYRPVDDWPEGAHEVVVSSVVGAQEIADSVNFKIDTIVPEILGNTLTVENSTDTIKIEVKISGNPRSVSVNSGDFSQEMAMIGGEYYSAQVQTSNFSTNVGAQIVAIDEAGNYAMLDISKSVLGSETASQTPISLGSLGNTSFTSTFNIVAILCLVCLLLFDGIYLMKLNMIGTRGKTLFPLALMVLILGTRLISGSGGVIS